MALTPNLFVRDPLFPELRYEVPYDLLEYARSSFDRSTSFFEHLTKLARAHGVALQAQLPFPD